MTMRQDSQQGISEHEQAEKERGCFFALSLDLLCIAGFDGYFKHLNSAWEKTLGFANEELLSKPYLAFVHPEDQVSTIAEAQKLSAGGVTITFQNRYLCKDGSYRWLSWNATPLRDQHLIYATARDITERKRTEKRRTAQYDVTRVLAESATMEEATPKLLQAVCESVEWGVGSIWSVDKQANLLRCIDLWHAPTLDVAEFKRVSRVMTFPPGIGLPGRVWASGEPTWIADVMKDTNFPRVPLAKTTGLHGAFGFPILFGGEVTGVIEFFSREVREPDDDLLKMMSALGSQIGQFMARKQGDVEREQLIGELKGALANIKTLRGLLPICASCNKIRDDTGSWNRLEEYISARSEAAFTHGICTECAKKLHPDWDEA